MECVKDKGVIHLSPHMTHNKFKINDDLISPIKTFFQQINLTI